jgi:hypothetical protein
VGHDVGLDLAHDAFVIADGDPSPPACLGSSQPQLAQPDRLSDQARRSPGDIRVRVAPPQGLGELETLDRSPGIP